MDNRAVGKSTWERGMGDLDARTTVGLGGCRLSQIFRVAWEEVVRTTLGLQMIVHKRQIYLGRRA